MTIAARDVSSPNGIFDEIKVICDGGADGFSIAKAKEKGKSVYLFRWNGGEDDNKKGYPGSRGYPTWIRIPNFDELAKVLMNIKHDVK